MGNHEYCVDCGESNFHRNRDCDPDKKARVDKQNQERDERAQRLRASALKWVERLKAQGLPAKIGVYGDVVLDQFELEKIE